MGEMAWIAGWFPLLSIVLPIVVYGRWHNTLAATLVVFVPLTVAMAVWFQIGNFWPWLLLYLLLCWMTCFAMSEVVKRRRSSKNTEGRTL